MIHDIAVVNAAIIRHGGRRRVLFLDMYFFFSDYYYIERPVYLLTAFAPIIASYKTNSAHS